MSLLFCIRRDNGLFSKKERQLIQKFWSPIESDPNGGITFAEKTFKNLLTNYSEIREVFRNNLDEEYIDLDMEQTLQEFCERHATKFINLMEDIIENIKRTEYIDRQIKRLSQVHEEFNGWSPCYIQSFKVAMVSAWYELYSNSPRVRRINDRDRKQMEETWAKLFDYIEQGMQQCAIEEKEEANANFQDQDDQ